MTTLSDIILMVHMKQIPGSRKNEQMTTNVEGKTFHNKEISIKKLKSQDHKSHVFYPRKTMNYHHYNQTLNILIK